MNRDKHQLNIGSESAMRWHTSASSSSAGIADDIFRLIPLNERAAFREMLEIEFHGRELSDRGIQEFCNLKTVWIGGTGASGGPDTE